MSALILRGDARALPLPDCSVDAVVCDPPYALEGGFMGNDWDRFATPGQFQAWCQTWAAEALRVLKPGGHLIAFGGTRTWHRLVCGIEDAGFEIRENLAWLFGTGFPKSLDVSKAIDRKRDDRTDALKVAAFLAAARDEAGLTNSDLDREFGFNGMAGHWTARPELKIVHVPTWEQWLALRALVGFGDDMDVEVWRLNERKGTPGEAWNDREVIGERSTGRGTGRGRVVVVHGSDDTTLTAPASEAAKRWDGWGSALKPGFEPIAVARKPLIGTIAANVQAHGTGAINIAACRLGDATTGRWPANVLLDEASADVLDGQSGVLVSGANPTRRGSDKFRNAYGDFKGQQECEAARGADSGGASRFFPVFHYDAKASDDERPVVDGVAHETVKPVSIMSWLVKLVTPPGGLILDPFAGSGTTLEAALLEGFRIVGIERDPKYLPLIQYRVDRAKRRLQPGISRLRKTKSAPSPAQMAFEFDGAA